jgi:hypothetical protein
MSVAPSTSTIYTNKLTSLFRPIPRFIGIFVSVYVLPIVLFLIVILVQQNYQSREDGIFTMIYLASSYLIILLYALITLLIGTLSLTGVLEMILFMVISLLFGISYAIVLNNLKLIFNRTTASVKQKSVYLKTASGLALLGILTGVIMLASEIFYKVF